MIRLTICQELPFPVSSTSFNKLEFFYQKNIPSPVLHIHQQCFYVALCKNYFIFVKKTVFCETECGELHNCMSFVCSVSWHCLLHQTTSAYSHQLPDTFLSAHTGIRIKFITTGKREITVRRHSNYYFFEPALPNPLTSTNFMDLWIPSTVNNPRQEPTKPFYFSLNCSVTI